MVHTPIWIHNLCMCMRFAPLYKSVTLSVQCQCANCTKNVQGCPLCSILINLWTMFLFSCNLRVTHSHTTHSYITHSSHALYYTCALIFERLPHQWSLGNKIWIQLFLIFLNQNIENMVNPLTDTHSLIVVWNLL